MEINGSCILVTGGTKGIGRQFATELAKQGARVGVCGTRERALQDLEQEFAAEGFALWTRCADVSSPHEVERLFADFVEDHGRIDGLVNNAGITRDHLLVKRCPDGTITKMPLENWNRVVDVNLTGVFLCGREAASHMIERGTRGTIVNISSVCRAGNVGQTAYAAAKAGIVAMTVTWAKELSRYGIRVTSIAPGYVSTEMTNAMKPEIRERIEKMIPTGRMAQCQEVASALSFVLQNDYIHGRVLELDGGLRI